MLALGIKKKKVTCSSHVSIAKKTCAGCKILIPLPHPKKEQQTWSQNFQPSRNWSWMHFSTACWFGLVFVCFSVLGVLFCVFVFLGKKKNRKLIFLSTNKIRKQNVHKHKCQEKILIVLWLCKKSWEGLPHSKYWVLPEDLESCERKG